MIDRKALVALGVVVALGGTPVQAHPGHSVKKAEGTGVAVRLPTTEDAVSGQGALRFRVLYGSERLPEKARAVLGAAHGGFAVDRRPGRGEIYFALPGAGILRIAADLRSIELVETDAAMRELNLHNTTLWQGPDGTAFLSFPANDAGRVFTTTLEGDLVHTLEPPAGASDLGHPTVNDYSTGA